MATKPSEEILKRAKAELSPDERLRLAAELTVAGTEKTRKITELRGLGKDVRQGIDPDAYVAQERDSWGG
jgi:hypothetical protein